MHCKNSQADKGMCVSLLLSNHHKTILAPSTEKKSFFATQLTFVCISTKEWCFLIKVHNKPQPSIWSHQNYHVSTILLHVSESAQ